MADSFSYPTAEFIRYGAWLKHFVAQLPELAARFALSESRLRTMQRLNRRYLSWLLDQATESQLPATKGVILLVQAYPLVEHLQGHPAFDLTDTERLRLADIPWGSLLEQLTQASPASSPRLDRTSIPAPRLTALLYPGKNVVVMWGGCRGVRFELQVSRNGRAWHVLPTLDSRPYRVMDAVPLSLKRHVLWRYRGRFVAANGQAGAWSATLQVLLTPADSPPPARPILVSTTA